MNAPFSHSLANSFMQYVIRGKIIPLYLLKVFRHQDGSVFPQEGTVHQYFPTTLPDIYPHHIFPIHFPVPITKNPKVAHALHVFGSLQVLPMMFKG